MEGGIEFDLGDNIFGCVLSLMVKLDLSKFLSSVRF